jgi:dephospho-CoA kinase
LRIGLTGGIGAGKSTVSAFFEKCGAKIISSDAITQELLDRSDIQEQLIEIFGSKAIKDGKTDRKYLSEEVFLEPDLRLKLEAIIHPEVRKRVIHEFRITPEGEIAINEVPLLFEVGLDNHYDLIISVISEKEKRIQRTLQRGLSRADTVARMSAQVEDDERIAKSDIVIENDGDLIELEQRVKEVWKQISASKTK